MILSVLFSGCAVLPKSPVVIPEKEIVAEANDFPEQCEWYKRWRVVDGDTLKVGGVHRVRLIGIDTPEAGHHETEVEPLNEEATRFLRDLLDSSERICLMKDSTSKSVDQYGRMLRYVYTERGVDAQIQLLEAGLAEYMRTFPYSKKAAFRKAEGAAKKSRRGLWE